MQQPGRESRSSNGSSVVELQSNGSLTVLRQNRQEPGLIAFYDIRPGNGAGLFLQPRSLHGTSVTFGGIAHYALGRPGPNA